MFKGFFIVIVVFIAFGNSEKKLCTQDSECGTGECCDIQTRWVAVGRKRQVTTTPTIKLVREGRCGKYALEGDWCGGFTYMLAPHCGCAPGLNCTYHHRTDGLPGGNSYCRHAVQS